MWLRNLIMIVAVLISSVSLATNFAPGHILVGRKADVSDSTFSESMSNNGHSVLKHFHNIRTYMIATNVGDEQNTVNKLKHNPLVSYAELDMAVAPAFVPNDPLLSGEWYVPDINVESAWNYVTGSGLIVAVLDTGIDATHPDLSAHIIPGYNVFNNNNDTTDISGHGSSTAGTVAAIFNNGVGVTGIAGNASIMPVVIAGLVNGSPYAYYSTMAAGVTYAADHGAKVATMSFENSYMSSAVIAAAQYLQSKGGQLVVAANNNGINEGYPAVPSMVVVSATNSSDVITSWSSYGPMVTVAAPGQGIYTTTWNNGYCNCSGTSFSTPMTAGVLLLEFSANPNLTPQEAVNILTGTAKDEGAPGWDIYYGAGIINAGAAVQAALNFVAPPPPPPVCNYSISPASASFSAAGGSGSVTVIVNGGCNWSASSSASWITITSGINGSGNGIVDYSVSSNTGSNRSANLTIGDQTFIVSEAGVAVCHKHGKNHC